MMTLRTPRRRISPRTRKRYRAIRNFFKRAIGSPSQPDIEINSSIAVNVTDLNRKIVGLEQQLSEVSKTCREFIDLEGSRNESSTRRDARSITTDGDLKDDVQTQKITASDSRRLDTKILYKTPETQYRQFEQSDCTPKHSKETNESQYKMKHNSVLETQKKKNKSNVTTKIKNTNQNLRSASDNIVSSYSTTSSFHSLAALKADHKNLGYSGDYIDKRAQKKEARFHNDRREANEQHERPISKNYHRYEDRAVKHIKSRTSKHGMHELDQDFIADIIKRQYKPLKLFGRRESDVSQFSEPMCRDHELKCNENIQNDTDLCSCCYRGRHSPKPNNNTRSACDTRLYSSVQIPRLRCRRGRPKAYNDTELYDLIPVKEKSSPKTRRKFYQDNLASYHDYREVLPSPRTHRPRLNLKAQYSESEDQTDVVRQSLKRMSPIRQISRHDVTTESADSDQLSIKQIPQTRKRKQERLLVTQEPVHQDMGTMSSLQYPEHFDIDDCTPKTQVTVSSDKTDRAICEIKDILQTFLQEIKKEASSSGKSEASNKTDSNSNQQVNASELTNNGYNLKMNSAAQCSNTGSAGIAGPPSPFMPAFTNPCCYPIMPMYPMLQNSFGMPSPSYSCKCVSKNEDNGDNKSKPYKDETFQNSTDELIKEIYKFVAQSPTFSKKKDVIESEPKTSNQNKELTSRSVGGSQVQKQDVKVGTQIRCYSKSCEALRSGVTTSQVYSSFATYSDTVLENQSHEATMTSSETELTSELLEIEKKKENKFGKVLRSFGLFKKKKETSEELSESTTEVDVKNRRPNFRGDGSPYRQTVTNYMMHGREYYRNPPIHHDYAKHRYPLDYADHMDSRNYADNRDPLNYAERDDPQYYAENPDPQYYSQTPNTRDHAERSDPRFYADHMNCRDYTERLDPRDYLEPPVRRDYSKPPIRRDYSGRYQQDYQSPYNPVYPSLPPSPENDPYYEPRMHQRYDHRPPKIHSRRPSAASPAQYSTGFDRYGQIQSAANAQVPLCLKEIEVKSMATQSERKLSFFHKIKQKMHTPIEHNNGEPKALATQTKNRMWKPPPEKSSLWKTWQTKAMEGKQDHLAFSYMQQQKLAAGDTNMRNKIIKKMFHKRNPFSPRNLIVKTLLGKDKSSFGNPPAATFRPRIFL